MIVNSQVYKKNTDLISIGLVSDNDEYFYREVIDYDKNKIDHWLEENIISNLKFGGNLYFKI